MARGGTDKSGGVRKKQRANSMGLQWWRKLTLPRRGKKDSMLEPTTLNTTQQNRLADRRAALLKAIVAPRVARQKHMATAEWDKSREMARVTALRGNSIQSMGKFDNGKQYLYPEEALFLVDRGTLDLLVDGHPASFQRAWALAMTTSNCISLEQYLTYAHLRRGGYVVRRFKADDDRRVKGLVISFSAWRVGSFKRKEPIRPLFYVCVYRYQDQPPCISDVSRFLDSAGKSRLKFSLIDRGVVVLTDVASNATPLSDRFINRLSVEEKKCCS